MYRKLVEFHKEGKLSFKYVKTFNMDEYVGTYHLLLYTFNPWLASPLSGIPNDHPESYHTYMWKNFFQHIDIDPVNVHILDGNAEDLQQECDSFETKIKEAGGVDLFIGGKNGYS